MDAAKKQMWDVLRAVFVLRTIDGGNVTVMKTPQFVGWLHLLKSVQADPTDR